MCSPWWDHWHQIITHTLSLWLGHIPSMVKDIVGLTSSFIICVPIQMSRLTNTTRLLVSVSAKINALLHCLRCIPADTCAGLAYPIYNNSRQNSLAFFWVPLLPVLAYHINFSSWSGNVIATCTDIIRMGDGSGDDKERQKYKRQLHFHTILNWSRDFDMWLRTWDDYIVKIARFTM